MKKLFALLLFLPSAAFADIKQEFVTSAQITVDMPYVVTNKVGTTYSPVSYTHLTLPTTRCV